MKPIRIYANSYRRQLTSSDYYIWDSTHNCGGGGGCSNCCFSGMKNFSCSTIIEPTVITYLPTTGYVELSPESHPELFI